MLHNLYFKVVLFFTSLIYFLRPRFIEPPTKPLFTPFTFYYFNLLGWSKRNASLLTQGLSHFQTSLCCNSSIFFSFELCIHRSQVVCPSRQDSCWSSSLSFSPTHRQSWLVSPSHLKAPQQRAVNAVVAIVAGASSYFYHQFNCLLSSLQPQRWGASRVVWQTSSLESETYRIWALVAPTDPRWIILDWF